MVTGEQHMYACLRNRRNKNPQVTLILFTTITISIVIYLCSHVLRYLHFRRRSLKVVTNQSYIDFCPHQQIDVCDTESGRIPNKHLSVCHGHLSLFTYCHFLCTITSEFPIFLHLLVHLLTMKQKLLLRGASKCWL